ncbi:MAG: TrmH family RNA methyltransferase [Actinomycetota bacterium]
MTGAKPLSPTELKRLHRQWRRDTELRLSLLLDGVQKPFNVGALLRSAAAYNVETVWRAAPTPPFSGSGVAKTALGSDRFVAEVEVDDGPAGVVAAKAAGFTVVAIELTGDAEPIHALTLATFATPSPAVCLVLGHEDRGVHIRTLEAVDHVAFIPQLGKIGSLNVAHAGTVALYEITRQSWADQAPSH